MVCVVKTLGCAHICPEGMVEGIQLSFLQVHLVILVTLCLGELPERVRVLDFIPIGSG